MRPAIRFHIAPDGFTVGLYKFRSIVIHSSELTPLNLLTQHQFDPADHSLVYRRDQGIRVSGALSTPGTPNTMHIIFRLHRYIIIDDMGNTFHVNPPRGDIGRHQDLEGAVAGVEDAGGRQRRQLAGCVRHDARGSHVRGLRRALAQAPGGAQKVAAVGWIDAHASDLSRLSDQVWAYAETGLRETKSAEALASYAAAQGFRVRRGVADMPTAFVAEYGQGAPVIGVLGEYDALPGISQKAQPVQEPLEAGAAGHGCGHNLLGVGALGAAVAIKEQIAAGRMAGTIRFYGTPAEESVGGKLYMVRAGLFKDADIIVSWHPGDDNNADTRSSQAMVDFIVEFHGKTAHAAYDPWNGRSAVDGLEIFTQSLNYLREHVKPTVRMHYTIVDGGKVPNVVPDYAPSTTVSTGGYDGTRRRAEIFA